MIVFNNYSDAIRAIRSYTSFVKNVLGSDFRTHNWWYPYIRIDYLKHPISLLGQARTHSVNFIIGKSWSRHFVHILVDGCPDDDIRNDNGFFLVNYYNRVLHWDEIK